MTAKEFLKTGIRHGDLVVLNEKTTCFFGGYKTFEGTQPDLDFSIFPVFYAIGKKGQMVRRSAFPGRLPYIGFSDVKSICKAHYPTFEVTMYNRYATDEKVTEVVQANSPDEAERIIHDRWFPEGWGVLGSKKIKD